MFQHYQMKYCRKNPYLDAVAKREYEYSVRDLARSLRKRGSNENLSAIKRISFRKNGKVRQNPDREPIDNLDDLSFVSRVYRDHLRSHINSYFYIIQLNTYVF